eukprot:12119956-Heterocapsa_arctica.AAC.1
MERTLKSSKLLDLEVQTDELTQIRRAQEEPTEDMDVVALYTELSPRSTCTASMASTGEFTREELRGHCKNVH